MASKLERIKELLRSGNPNLELVEEKQPDGSTYLIGPFPSFIFLLDRPGQPDGYIVSVNADAPNSVYFVITCLKEFPDLEYFGPYGEDRHRNEIIGGPDAYKLKEEFILNTAVELLELRKQRKAEQPPELIVPDQKIILAK